MRLVPCTECQRHANADAGPCPFCGGRLSESVRRGPPRAFRVTRAAIFYFGLSACSGGGEAGEPEPPPVEAPVVNPYGAPVDLEEEAVDPEGEPQSDEQASDEEQARREQAIRALEQVNSAPAYGAPPQPPE